ncbi:MAG: hypothetical protein C0601_09355 [Candidatus Muiribacterium halophilum]|uniref:Histidine kinase/HSP90-like ATPase domain-containing protein n=1 Tax=Muiribacterium halophilum TaxID=2053465 RepID=A0A2N5ZDN5_MUIH1|nr:MAG: hypothetical protein C0601_09355 [Candidatus Muirbacterium halophilum]
MLKSYKKKRESIDNIKKDLEQFFSAFKIPDDMFHDIKLSVVELVSNIIKYTKDQDVFVLELDMKDNTVKISLKYIDKSFNRPQSKFKGEAMQESGLGVFLVSELMDRLDYFYNEKTFEVEVQIEKRITT